MCAFIAVFTLVWYIQPEKESWQENSNTSISLLPLFGVWQQLYQCQLTTPWCDGANEPMVPVAVVCFRGVYQAVIFVWVDTRLFVLKHPNFWKDNYLVIPEIPQKKCEAWYNSCLQAVFFVFKHIFFYFNASFVHIALLFPVRSRGPIIHTRVRLRQ